MNNDLKIIYCKDEEENIIFYNDTIKGNKYYCIDCDGELIVKDGKVKAKHLAHKTSCNCVGTGESVFHKHWKESMFKKGLFIKVDDEDIEILNVLNEVPLSKRYNKDWDREIIVDTLLETSQGDIIVEIHYTNKKDWLEIEKYYDTIKEHILEVYEVTVPMCVNEKVKWETMDEIYIKKFKPLRLTIYPNTVLFCGDYVSSVSGQAIDLKTESTYKEITVCINNDTYKKFSSWFSHGIRSCYGGRISSLQGKENSRNLHELFARGVLSIDSNGDVSGKSYENKELLKKCGFKWIPERKVWNAGKHKKDYSEFITLEFNRLKQPIFEGCEMKINLSDIKIEMCNRF